GSGLNPAPRTRFSHALFTPLQCSQTKLGARPPTSRAHLRCDLIMEKTMAPRSGARKLAGLTTQRRIAFQAAPYAPANGPSAAGKIFAFFPRGRHSISDRNWRKGRKSAAPG